MSELHQKLAVLSSSLNSTSPQPLPEGQPHPQYQQVAGNVVYSQQSESVSQMVVDSTTAFGHLQQQQQHQMQTVVVNPMLGSSSSASGSPMVVNVPANNNNLNVAGSARQMSGSPAMAGVTSIPVQSTFHGTGTAVPMHSQSHQPAVSVAHPSLLITATQSPNGINSSTPPAMANIHHTPHHHLQQQPQLQPQTHHHHPINDLASMSMISTPPTTTTIVTTNKLTEAVTNQGASGPAVSVSIDGRRQIDR